MRTGTAVEAAGPELEPTIGRLWQLFSHDLSEFRDRPPDADGSYPLHGLPSYFTGDPTRRAYVLWHAEKLAGFALVRAEAGVRHLDGFFVVRPLRRRRVGHDAARELLLADPGAWEIGFQQENPGAARFWRQLAPAVAGAAWREEARPVPGKPWLPEDRFLLLDTGRVGLAARTQSYLLDDQQPEAGR